MNHNERCDVLAKEIACKRFPMKVSAGDCRGSLARFSIYNQTSLRQRKGIIVHMVQTWFKLNLENINITLSVELNIDIILFSL